MSRDPRKEYYRDRDRDWGRSDYRSRLPRKRSRSRTRSPNNRDRIPDKRHSRSPRKNEKEITDILIEISKLPEPSELWDGNQFQEGNFAGPPQPSYPSIPQEGVPNPPYGSNYQPPYSGIYDDFPPVASVPQSAHLPDMAAWNQMSLPPPPQTPMQPPIVQFNVEDQIKKEAAIESEMRHQKAALSKQREDYIKKTSILKKELETLKEQRNELHGDSKRSPSPDTKRFLKENTKLQLEIQNKLKTINNVVDMLNGIIGEEARDIPETDDTERPSKRKSRSPSNPKFNYVYYDPEMHWCRVCNEFPPTAKDYLNHLHSPSHHKMAAAHMEAPWHTVTGVNEGFPSYPAAPTKRTPIRGLQFFVPSTAWYCKLCDQFIGDLHCASAHLKSIVHSKNYINFVEQNPHWETDWMSDRQKAFEKSRASKVKAEDKPQYTAHTITFSKDGFHTKRKDSPTPPSEEKKKKKDKKKKSKKKKSSSSSSSSNSSSSDSEPVRKKKKSKKEKISEPDDKRLTEWMSSIQMEMLNDSDRELLQTLKSKMKSDKRDDKRRSPSRQEKERYIAEIQRKTRESERRETRVRDELRRRDDRRDDRREERRDDRRDERRDDRRDERRSESHSRNTPPRDTKKPEVKKMPFIGKMPVYKHLGKNTKLEDHKKGEQKKKEEEGVDKKRREEMDAEIQKKVAEFKEKIAKAQLLPSYAAPAPAPAAAAPAPAAPAAPAPTHAAAPASNLQPSLPKDFQDALDIIFPTEVKPDLNQPDLFAMSGLGFPLGMPPFPGLGILGQAPMPPMFGFDLNAPIFPPRPQLYDTHVPLVPAQQKQRPNKNYKNTKQGNKAANNKQQTNSAPKTETMMKRENEENGDIAKKKEEMDDLAMLGIDASDVGAGM
ncbi:zinc finger matrin-type protein CG9776-like isoform X2 [Galleria mellonella]|uniref:Zinc finger matrin-type protein CG9776-like isoform X2 n=1 Tax=Galleria mellonella TaxID=7137 RepID=A0A6J3BUG5_GALME|nr:zinc finger matrin-type protein CG9776-like isoform X2 [Galleria mellonella]